MTLCLPVSDTLPGSNVITPWLCTETGNSGWIPLLACCILIHDL